MRFKDELRAATLSPPLLRAWSRGPPRTPVTTGVHNEERDHLWFLENLDRVNRAIQGTDDLDQMMRDVLDTVLSMLGCDRAWLLYPCDPAAASWSVPMERTAPGYPGALARAGDIPMDPDIADRLRWALASDAPVKLGPGTAHPLACALEERFGVLSTMFVCLRPRGGDPWLFGMHQCSYARTWEPDEERLFQETGRRLTDALSMLLILRREREASARVTEILESVADAFLALDADWRYTYVNKIAAAVVNCRPEDMLGKKLWDRAPYLLGTEFEVHLRHAMAERVAVRFEYQRPPDGRWFDMHVYPANEGLSVYATEITARKQAQEALHWRTALFEAQVESAVDGLLVVDATGKKVLQNERMTEIWKIPRHLAEGDDDAEMLRFVTSQTRNPVEFGAKVAYLYSHPDEVSRDEVELLDGTMLERYSSPVRDKVGKHYGRIWTFRDITERRKLEEQYRQAQKMEAVGQLAGGIAHDFNNLLSVIQMQSSLLLTPPVSDEETAEGLEEIMSAAERAANLTRQLLTFSRRAVTEAKDTDLGAVIDNMMKLFRRLLGDDIMLEMRLAPSLPWASADTTMMEQVLMNLAVNARDAMPDGGKMTVAVDVVTIGAEHVSVNPRAREGVFLRVDVTDTGCGIPPENHTRIFEPFFTSKDVGKGTGLGLATVFGIVEQHRGWIDVRSEVGHGTTFSIFIPAIPPSPRQGAAHVALPAAPCGDETILLVEDDASVRKLVRAVLERQGYVVLQAASAVEAIVVWEQRVVDIQLLLTDLVMPGMSGGELADELMKRQPGLRVLYTSGYSNEVVNRRLNLEPWRNFLPKPCSALEIATTVRARLDAPTDEPGFPHGL